MQAPRPLVIVVDPDPVGLTRLSEALTRRYSADYEVVSFSGAAEAIAQLGEAAREVALLIAPETVGDAHAFDFFERARSSARRRSAYSSWSGDSTPARPSRGY